MSQLLESPATADVLVRRGGLNAGTDDRARPGVSAAVTLVLSLLAMLSLNGLLFLQNPLSGHTDDSSKSRPGTSSLGSPLVGWSRSTAPSRSDSRTGPRETSSGALLTVGRVRALAERVARSAVVARVGQLVRYMTPGEEGTVKLRVESRALRVPDSFDDAVQLKLCVSYLNSTPLGRTCVTHTVDVRDTWRFKVVFAYKAAARGSVSAQVDVAASIGDDVTFSDPKRAVKLGDIRPTTSEQVESWSKYIYAVLFALLTLAIGVLTVVGRVKRLRGRETLGAA